MDSNFSSRPKKLDSDQDSQCRSFLVLHNDEVNTFEFVMDTLVEVCKHSANQAEQCAMIAHYKGKCEVLMGEPGELKLVCEELISRGLKATIE
ncbi:ATP-dependent Clp protease adaptor ClpS [Bacteroidota bacterium]